MLIESANSRCKKPWRFFHAAFFHCLWKWFFCLFLEQTCDGIWLGSNYCVCSIPCLLERYLWREDVYISRHWNFSQKNFEVGLMLIWITVMLAYVIVGLILIQNFIETIVKALFFCLKQVLIRTTDYEEYRSLQQQVAELTDKQKEINMMNEFAKFTR